VFESIEGGLREIFLPIKQNCDKCREKGLLPVNNMDMACSVCAGTGWQTLKSDAAEMKIPCKFCHGTKIAKRTLCSNCDGLGYTIEQRKLVVSIPTMVEEGQLLKVKHPTRKRELVFKLSIDHSPDDFIRRGFDLHSKVEISFTLAILGGATMVRGLRHQLYVKVEPGTQTGQTIKLAGKGIRKFNSNKFGDHIVTIGVKLPERLTSQQKRLIEDFARTETGPK
jgi:molecular chaperone DnaJ